jgi:hypothetical protein
VAVKVADVEPAGTIRQAGAVNAELLEVRPTEDPPDGAGRFRITVHVVEPPGATLEGLHATEVASTAGAARGGVNVKFAVRELTPKVAVMLAPWFVVTKAAAAVKLVEVDPAATVTEAGTVRPPVLLLSATVVPPAGAAALSVTVQFALPGVTMEAGLHPSELRLTAGVTVMLLPVPLMLRLTPLGSTPSVPATPIFVVPDASVREILAVATTPSPIAVAFTPDARQV